MTGLGSPCHPNSATWNAREILVFPGAKQLDGVGGVIEFSAVGIVHLTYPYYWLLSRPRVLMLLSVYATIGEDVAT